MSIEHTGLFYISLMLYLLAIIFKKSNTVDQYYLLTFFVILQLIPMVFGLPDAKDLHLIFLFVINVNFYIILIYFIVSRPTSALFKVNKKNTGPYLDLDFLHTYQKQRFSQKTIFFIIFIQLLILLYGLSTMYVFSFGESRDVVWAAKVQIEAEQGTGVGGLIKLLFSGLFLVAVYDGLTSKVKKIRKRVFFLFVIISILTLSKMIFSGLYRSPIVFYSAFVIVVYHLFVHRIHYFNKYLFLGGVLSPIFLSFAALVRSGGDNFNISILHGLSGISTIFEMHHIMELVKEGGLKIEYGVQHFYNAIIFIPRFFWQDKPVVSFSYRLSEEIYGKMGENAWVHTYTPWGEGYLQFGIIGTMVNTVIILYIISFLKKYIHKHPQYMLFLLSYFIVSFPIYIRGDLSAIIALMYKFVFVIIFVKVIHLTINILHPNFKNK